MRILAFSDLHRDKEAARDIVQASSDADIVVGAGDFATDCLGASDTLDILRKISVPTVIVSGNHDNLDDLENLCLDWPSCHLLHGESVSIGTQVFFGLGNEIPGRSDQACNPIESEEEAAALLSSCPQGAVLVTHTPPFGYCDLQPNGRHEGSLSIRDTLKMRCINLHLCGHIHYSWRTNDTFEGCAIYNLGPSINWFDI